VKYTGKLFIFGEHVGGN